MSFKKQIFALFVFTILGLGLFGQNCSQSEFLADEKAQKNQNSSITPLEAKASNRVVVDHRTLQLLKNEELKLFIENAKESGGEVRQVLPNGDMELIYATVEEAQAAVKQNLDLNSSHEKINSEKQIILKSIPDYVSQQTAIKKFDLNKVKLMPLENIKQSDLQSDQPVQIVKPNKVSEFRDQVTKILNDFPILNKISNSTSQLNSKSILNTNQSIVGFDNSDSPFFPPIGDQLRLGSCVAWSVGYYLNSYTQAKTENMDINSSEGKRFLCSPSYLYPFTNGGFDLGTYPLQVLQTIQDFGCASLAESPYKTMMRYDGEYEKDYFPSLDFQKKALKYRIKKFDSIARNPVDKEGLKNIKQAIKNGSLLTIAIRAYDEFIYYNGTPLIKNVYCVKTFKERDLSYPQSVMTKIDKSCPSSGGHAVTIVGYDDDKQAFKIVNSWGSDWGVGGSIWISYELFKDTDFLIGDVFAVEDFPTEPVAKSYLVVLSEFDYLTFNYFKKSPLYYSVKSDNFKWDTALIRQNPPLARRRGSNLKSFALIHDLTPYLAQNKDINLSAPLIVSTTLINSPLIQNRIHWMDDFDYSSVLSIKKMKLYKIEEGVESEVTPLNWTQIDAKSPRLTPQLYYQTSDYDYIQNEPMEIKPIASSAITADVQCRTTYQLPPGLKLNRSTCVISGTPTLLNDNEIITVEVTTPYGESYSQVNFKVSEKSKFIPKLIYSSTELNFNKNEFLEIKPEPESNLPAEVQCNTYMPLPLGVTLNPSTCVISGTPTVTKKLTSIFVQAKTRVGISAGKVSFRVNDKNNLLFEKESYEVTIDQAVNIKPLNFQDSESCSISPSLSSSTYGITFNPKTCSFTGVAKQILINKTYTVTAKFKTAQRTAKVNLSIVEERPQIEFAVSSITQTIGDNLSLKPTSSSSYWL